MKLRQCAHEGCPFMVTPRNGEEYPGCRWAHVDTHGADTSDHEAAPRPLTEEQLRARAEFGRRQAERNHLPRVSPRQAAIANAKALIGECVMKVNTRRGVELAPDQIAAMYADAEELAEYLADHGALIL